MCLYYTAYETSVLLPRRALLRRTVTEIYVRMTIQAHMHTYMRILYYLQVDLFVALCKRRTLSNVSYIAIYVYTCVCIIYYMPGVLELAAALSSFKVGFLLWAASNTGMSRTTIHNTHIYVYILHYTTCIRTGCMCFIFPQSRLLNLFL